MGKFDTKFIETDPMSWKPKTLIMLDKPSKFCMYLWGSLYNDFDAMQWTMNRNLIFLQRKPKMKL